MNAMAFSTMVVLVAGGCLVQLDRFHPKTWWQSVRDSRRDDRPLPRRDAGDAARRAAVARTTASTRVRFGFGAGVDRSHHAPFEARFGFPLLEAWAMTETGAGACIMANREPRHVGTQLLRPRRAVRRDARRRRRRPRRAAPTRPASCWCAPPAPTRARDFFSGYLKDEAATEEAWAGGWFHTGDVVRRDADGQLLLRRPQEERDPPQRREHLGGRGRERARRSTRR